MGFSGTSLGFSSTSLGFSSTSLAVRVTPGCLKNIHLFVYEENEGRKLCKTTLPIALSWLRTVYI